jgi:hypothetical protein
MHALQSVLDKLVSSLTSIIALLVTSFLVLLTAMWPKQQCSSIIDTSLTAIGCIQCMYNFVQVTLYVRNMTYLLSLRRSKVQVPSFYISMIPFLI